MTAPVGALAGINVLDISEGVSGPYCAKLLAGLGATVVKVERPGVGDASRHYRLAADRLEPIEAHPLFLHLNTGKRSVTVDLDAEGGRGVLHDLVREWADVVVDSSSLSRAQARGTDWATLSALKPEVILASLSYFGHTGPYREYAGTELIALALGGYLYLTGEPAREPLKPYGYHAEYHAGLHAATGVAAAVVGRYASGLGDHVDASVVEAATFLASAAPGWAHFYGKDIKRAGNRLANADPGQGYPSTIRPCQDGWVHAHNNFRNPDLLAVLMDSERLQEPDVIAQPAGHADEIDEIMDRWLATRDRKEIVDLAQEMRLPFTEVFAPAEAQGNEQLIAREALVELDHPVAGMLTYVHAPLQFSETPWVAERAPLLGEHTDAFLQDVLRLEDGRLAEWRQKGVI
ncbi:MAG: CoA transferase [Dehalococcoidia bacterium]|nr:CoA transferase [Dehalococcoidia bacterium]